ncbi:apoptosis facilitator Bcl-2-like protein 14 isoform X2 [Lampris incognitus]|uniref:apoptosis facilitator Bcl-2-like protein 14 isoform X2 n=1 Tax=Lampris incognitus TaxID=2546036 RepID=UPI0024B5C15E|nr:apoptosis facilitator Bcl-2-like protein 14 isoform X2 [Lampris incognitus]
MADEQASNRHATTDSNATGNTTGETDTVQSVEDTVEFRLMMAYAQRRHRPDAPLRVPHKEEKERKEKKRKSWRRIFTCVTPQTGDKEEVGQDRSSCEDTDDLRVMNRRAEGEENLGEVTGRLMKIADKVFTPPDIEADGEEDDAEKLAGLLLREIGDELNEAVLKDANLIRKLLGDYGFFKSLMSAIFRKTGFKAFDLTEPQGSPKAEIALTCEVASRLSVVNTHPMNRLLGYGARYLQEHYSQWATQHGGYDTALESEDIEDSLE